MHRAICSRQSRSSIFSGAFADAGKSAERLWEIGDIVGVLEAWEAAQVRRSIWEEGHGMV
jgi:hypothetical protein